MFVDLILYIIGSFVGLVSGAFGLISFVVPAGIQNSILFVFEQLEYIDVFIPLNTLMQVLGSFIAFLTAWYSVKIILWIYALVPWFGKNTDLPKSDLAMYKAEDQHARFKKLMKGRGISTKTK